MKEIIEFIVVVSLFIFFFYFLYKLFLKANKKEEKKKEEKPAQETNKQQKKEDIPEILKEVTTGNYMHDIAKSVAGESSNAETGTIQIKETNEDFEESDSFDVEKAFDNIDNQDLIDVGIEEIEDDIMEEIDNEYDSILINDEEDYDKNSEKNNIAEEYNKLSSNMKALIIANFLDKKHHKE